MIFLIRQSVLKRKGVCSCCCKVLYSSSFVMFSFVVEKEGVSKLDKEEGFG